ncbi:MAG: photosystem II S4 domain protein [Acaryochloridaceae cyanobacterium CSU_3_4]|nr:photosystem II S4 domain protein [Acaryochloridaceae cyanobacterium CSU_3_4]
MLPKAQLLQSVEHSDCLSRLLDQATQALKTWEVVLSTFLSPPELAEAQQMFASLTEFTTLAWGGYAQAERQRLAIARADLPLDKTQVELAAISIAGNFLFDPASHRDFLGAILATGIDRNQVGDILVLGERGAQAIAAPPLIPFLETHLTQVRTVPVQVEAIPWEQLQVREPRCKEMTTVEASLRLDAIASAGFGLSRSKMVNLINTGEVRVNWKEISQASYTLKTGDLITIRGKGRLQLGEVNLTKKERYRIQMKRYS